MIDSHTFVVEEDTKSKRDWRVNRVNVKHLDNKVEMEIPEIRVIGNFKFITTLNMN